MVLIVVWLTRIHLYLAKVIAKYSLIDGNGYVKLANMIISESAGSIAALHLKLKNSKNSINSLFNESYCYNIFFVEWFV